MSACGVGVACTELVEVAVGVTETVTVWVTVVVEVAVKPAVKVRDSVALGVVENVGV
jgi:hypothetical protein